MIGYRLDALFAGTVGTTEERPFGLYAMTYNPASAMIADRSELMDGALEAVERMGMAGGNDLKSEIVVVPANLTSSHGSSRIRVPRLAVFPPAGPDLPAGFRGVCRLG